MRLLRIGEVQAVGRADWHCAGASNVARGFGNSVHRAEARIEIAPAAVAIERHGQPAFGPFNADHTGIARTRAFDGIGLYHVIVLLPDPAFAADIRARQQTLEIISEVAGFG